MVASWQSLYESYGNAFREDLQLAEAPEKAMASTEYNKVSILLHEFVTAIDLQSIAVPFVEKPIDVVKDELPVEPALKIVEIECQVIDICVGCGFVQEELLSKMALPGDDDAVMAERSSKKTVFEDVIRAIERLKVGVTRLDDGVQSPILTEVEQAGWRLPASPIAMIRSWKGSISIFIRIMQKSLSKLAWNS